MTVQVDEHNLDKVMDAYLLLQSFLVRHGKLRPKGQGQTSSAPTRSPRRTRRSPSPTHRHKRRSTYKGKEPVALALMQDRERRRGGRTPPSPMLTPERDPAAPIMSEEWREIHHASPRTTQRYFRQGRPSH